MAESSHKNPTPPHATPASAFQGQPSDNVAGKPAESLLPTRENPVLNDKSPFSVGKIGVGER